MRCEGRAKACAPARRVDFSGICRIESDSGKGRAGDDGEIRECPETSSRPPCRLEERHCPHRFARGGCTRLSTGQSLRERIESELDNSEGKPSRDAWRIVFDLLDALESGEVRAAERDSN